MSKELEKLIETTNKIETCLVGDKLTGQVGLVDKVDCVGEDMCEVKERLKVLEENDKKHIKIKKHHISTTVTPPIRAHFNGSSS